MLDSQSVILERLEFTRKNVTFKVKIYRPQNIEDAKGIVFFSHGLGYCDRQYKIDGNLFANNGYLMCIYNLRGHAATDGKWTLQDSVDDLIEAINAITAQYKFKNNNRVCTIGHSTGALITLLASLKDNRIKFGGVVTTVTCLKDSYLHWFKSGFNKDVKEFFKTKGVIPPIIEKFMDDKTMMDLYCQGKIPVQDLNIAHRYGLLKSDNWNEFFYEIVNSPDIIKSAGKIHMPLLLFRGEKDEVMDVNKTNELYEGLDKNIPSRLYITKSQNHFHNDSWDLIQNETMKFFDKLCQFSEEQKKRGSRDILIIDDEELVLKTLSNLLKKSGFEGVNLAQSGEIALKKIQELKEQKNKEFDLIISDIRMPGLDGIETIRRMRQIVSEMGNNQSPVIFMTGYEGERTQQEARDLGYVDYLFKPFDAQAFLQSVRKQLE